MTATVWFMNPGMFPEDHAAHLLGISIHDVSSGEATAIMTVRADMVNGLGVCHGGLLFTLADAAMAYASNAAVADGSQALATSATVDFLAPAMIGQTLRASATAQGAAGRSTIHDVDVRDENHNLIASFRGRTLTVSSPAN